MLNSYKHVAVIGIDFPLATQMLMKELGGTHYYMHQPGVYQHMIGGIT